MVEQKTQATDDARKQVTDTKPVGKDFKYFVRIVNTDLDGNKSIGNALRKIKGVGFMFSNMLC